MPTNMIHVIATIQAGGILLANVIYQTILLSLFSHFFVKTYLLRSNKDRISSSTHSETVTNGELTKLKEN